MRVRRKLATLKAARLIRCGGLVGHMTGTVAGVAASPLHRRGPLRLQRFKQRRGPFLLLADSSSRALRLAARMRPALRSLMREHWPGPVTLVFPAVPGLPTCCYRRGKVAIRVDADPETRRLAKLAGGLLLSSSLNRRSGRTAIPGRRLHLRWHRHLSACLPGGSGTGKASKIILIHGEEIRPIRA